VRKDNVVMTELGCVGAVPVPESDRETVKSVDRERKRRRRKSARVILLCYIYSDLI
jgi:hypothetical protein